jgi:hypothetical protein
MGIEDAIRRSAKAPYIGDEPGAFVRLILMAEEDRPERTPRPGGSRWFKSENVVCIEHFRKPHMPGQKAGRFGWLPVVPPVSYLTGRI